MSTTNTNADLAARRLLESFLEDVNEFLSGAGGFRHCTESERRALNDLMSQRYLVEGVDKLKPTLFVNKVKEIISDFINNKCRALEYCVEERLKEEKSHVTTTSWTCQVCGKINSEAANEKQRACCVVCGRKQDYKGSKKTQVLNKLRIDPTPLSTTASKQSLIEARKSYHKRAASGPTVFSTKADYEELQRCEIKSEINDVLESVRTIMGDIKE